MMIVRFPGGRRKALTLSYDDDVEQDRQLIAIRRENPFFTRSEVSAELRDDMSIAVTWTMDGETVAFAVINPNESEIAPDLPAGDWSLLLGESLQSVPAKGVLLVRG